MKNKEVKKIQQKYVKENMEFFFNLIRNNTHFEFNKQYVSQIKKLSQGFNIRLTREQKLQFCKKCEIPWNVSTRLIRVNSKIKTKEYICKKCGHIKRFRLE